MKVFKKEKNIRPENEFCIAFPLLHDTEESGDFHGLSQLCSDSHYLPSPDSHCHKKCVDKEQPDMTYPSVKLQEYESSRDCFNSTKQSCSHCPPTVNHETIKIAVH